MNNNQQKIIYKKTNDYDNSSTNSDYSQINLDDSVNSSDTDNNTNNNIQDNIEDNNINLRNNITKELSSELINITSNNIKINLDNKYIDDFIIFINNNNFDKIKDENTYKILIKSFIMQNNLNQEEIIIFLNNLKKINMQEFFLEPLNLIENFNTEEKYNEKEEKYNEKEDILINNLVNNDINAWIFIGIILISFIILIMIILNRK
jgi:hypothetical protein